VPKVKTLTAKGDFRDADSKGKFAATDLQLDWEDTVFHFKKGVFWKKLHFKDVVQWEVFAAPGTRRTKQGMIEILHIVRMATQKGLLDFAIPPQVFENWLYWIIRSLVKHSNATAKNEGDQELLKDKHKVKFISFRKVNEFDRAHQAFISTLEAINGEKVLTFEQGKNVVTTGKGIKGLEALDKLDQGFFDGGVEGERGKVFFGPLLRLGSGGSGTEIYKLSRILDDITRPELKHAPVAVKMLKMDSWTEIDTTKERVENTIYEAHVLAALGKHPNIVGVVDTAVFTRMLCLFLELGSEGDLKHMDRKLLGKADVLRWAVDILTGMAHIHKNRIYHLDMKPENVIVCKTDRGIAAKIIDFGLARSAALQNKKKRLECSGSWLVGTYGYMPPESWLENGQPNQKDLDMDEQLAWRDSFAVGMTLVNGLLIPYLNLQDDPEVQQAMRIHFGEGRDQIVARIHFLRKNLRPWVEKKKAKELYNLADLACAMLHKNPERRPFMDDALKWAKTGPDFRRLKNGTYELLEI
jgi:serine/threonine protein kinase